MPSNLDNLELRKFVHFKNISMTTCGRRELWTTGGLPECPRVLLASVNLARSPYAFPSLSVNRSSVYTIKTNDGPQRQHPTTTSSNQPPDTARPTDQAVR